YPAAIAAMAAALIAGAVAPAALLPGVILGAVVFWGILVSDVPTRDLAAHVDGMTAAASGGASQRYLRQFAATALLGYGFGATVLLRWVYIAPVRAAAFATGVLALSACASFLGRLSGGARLFLALFLFGVYIALNGKGMPALDVVGFAGDATTVTVLRQLGLGIVLLGGGYLYGKVRDR
ncbi:MAG TPA: hypothetical protein VIT92_15640, partial [Burkholderiaceae bacterium]